LPATDPGPGGRGRWIGQRGFEREDPAPGRVKLSLAWYDSFRPAKRRVTNSRASRPYGAAPARPTGTPAGPPELWRIFTPHTDA